MAQVLTPRGRDSVEPTGEHKAPWPSKSRSGTEFRIIRSGEVRWMVSRGKVIRDKSGRPERIIGASIDITERKRAEEELSRSDERFREMAETVPDILFTSDPDGGCDYLSSHYYEYTGLPPSAPIGPGCIDAVHPDDRDRILAARQRAQISGESIPRRLPATCRRGQLQMVRHTLARHPRRRRQDRQVVRRDDRYRCAETH